MAKFGKTAGYEQPKPKRSSSSGDPRRVKMSSMNKHKKRSYKKYRGQGR